MVAHGQVAGQGHGGLQPDSEQRGDRARHPLDPLDAREISQAVEILRREVRVLTVQQEITALLVERGKTSLPNVAMTCFAPVSISFFAGGSAARAPALSRRPP